MTTTTAALYFDAPGQVSLHDEPLAAPGPNEVRVRTLYSAISPGTEMLFFRGQVPSNSTVDSILPGMDRPPTYPLRYGYACVGRVCALGHAAQASWLDRLVFAFQPHAAHFNANLDHLLPVPQQLSAKAAALFPNMETAVSLLHDGAPLVGERVVLFGQGIVGLLTTWLLAGIALEQLTAVDALSSRRQRALSMGAHTALPPDALAEAGAMDPDLIYELTGNPAALRSAIELAGYHSRIVVGSWYGVKPVELMLGGSFHRNRVNIYSSQVSTLPASLSARWTKARRYAVAWARLVRLPYQDLITHCIPIAQAQSAYTLIAERPEETLQILLTYQES